MRLYNERPNFNLYKWCIASCLISLVGKDLLLFAFLWSSNLYCLKFTSIIQLSHNMFVIVRFDED